MKKPVLLKRENVNDPTYTYTHIIFISKWNLKFHQFKKKLKVHTKFRKSIHKLPPVLILGTMPQIMVIYGSLLILSRNNTEDNRIRPTKSHYKFMLDHEWPHRGDFIARISTSSEFCWGHFREATTKKKATLWRRRSVMFRLLHRDAAQLDKWKLMRSESFFSTTRHYRHGCPAAGITLQTLTRAST